MAEKSDNQDLVKALESIRGLLEKSETKLSAARSSLEKARQPSKSFKRPPISSEPVVPVLDDIVAEGLSDDDDLIPVLEVDEDDTSMLEVPRELTQPVISGHSTDDILASIDDFAETLEKNLHQMLIQAMVQIENDIKETLQEQVRLFKDEVENNRND